MIKLTKENIDKAIENKGNNIVKKNTSGYILTDETICTFNSLIIFKELFNNRCKMLDSAFENLYYIANRLIGCNGNDDEGDGGGGTTPTEKYYNVAVSSNKEEAHLFIGGIERTYASFKEGTKNIVLKATCEGYNDLGLVIQSLDADFNYRFEFTNEDKLPDKGTINVVVVEYINGQQYAVEGATVRLTGTYNGENKVYNINSGQFDVNTIATIHVNVPDGYDNVNDINVNVEEGTKSITVELTKQIVINRYRVTVNSNVVNSIIRINDSTVIGTTNSVVFDEGTHVDIEVSKEGYTTFTQVISSLDRDYTINANIEEILPDTAILTVVPNPSNAIVTIYDKTNNVSYNTTQKSFPVGTRVQIKGELEGYEDFLSEEFTLNTDRTYPLTLQPLSEQLYTISVNVVDSENYNQISNAEIRITNLDDNTTTMGNVGQFKHGTRLRIVASASEQNYFDNTLDYTVNKNDAVNNTITKQISLEKGRILRILTYRGNGYTEGVNTPTIVLTDSNNIIQQISNQSNNLCVYNKLKTGTYRLQISKNGYASYDQNITISSSDSDTITKQINLIPNVYKLKVVVRDADNNQTVLQSANVIVNGTSVPYSNGQSDEVDIAYGDAVRVVASATNYNSSTVSLPNGMPAQNYTMYIDISQSIANVNINVKSLADNTLDITRYCIVKVNGETVGNQIANPTANVAPGEISIEVSCEDDGEHKYVTQTFTRTVVAGTNNITLNLAPYIRLVYTGFKGNTNTQVPINYIEMEQNEYEITRISESSYEFLVPYGQDMVASFSSQYYSDIIVEKRNIGLADEGEYRLEFQATHVKITLSTNPSGATIWYQTRENIVTQGYIMVPKNTQVTFGAYKTGYVDATVSRSFSQDSSLEIRLQTPIYFHLKDIRNNPITNATISLHSASDPQGEIYDDYDGQQIEPGTYYVEFFDDIFSFEIDAPGFIQYTATNQSVVGEKHFNITMQDGNINLTVSVKNKANNQNINDATIWIDNVISPYVKSVSKGIHTISVYKAGFGKQTKTVEIYNSTTVEFLLSDKAIVNFNIVKGDILDNTRINGIIAKYVINGVNYPITLSIDNPVDYEIPYNTNFQVVATATNYESLDEIEIINDTSDAAKHTLNYSLERLYDLFINVVDDETGDVINDAQIDVQIQS